MNHDERIPPGALVLKMLHALEEAGIPTVYLRNYEGLPAEVGNDVDLLIPARRKTAAAELLEQVALRHGWLSLGRAHFSPLALYFGDPETAETLHLDLFERLEWHFLEFADAKGILSRRNFNGRVHIPDPSDEIYLNLATRLIYQGRIRDKHREQASARVAESGLDPLLASFQRHLGAPGRRLAEKLAADEWQASGPQRRRLVLAALRSHALLRPARLAAGLIQYAARIVRKLWRPPGRFIVLEGADGSGKSTVLKAILPWCSHWSAGRDPYDFHWKPVRLHCGPRREAPSVDPRGRKARSPLPSLLYLAYHVLGYWSGWLLRIRPLLAKSHAVIGDRYSYDLFLDPERFRLRLPLWICRAAALMTPRPDLAIGLVADPELVHARKPELQVEEIARYQRRWEQLATGRKGMATVAADGPPDEVILKVKRAILTEITRSLATKTHPPRCES